MMEMVEIVENRHVNGYIYNQLKKIKKNNINATSILIKLSNQISKDYNLNFTSDELIIKIDRKKDFNEVKNRILLLLTSLVPIGIDINFIFKILFTNNELILRPKRNV